MVYRSKILITALVASAFVLPASAADLDNVVYADDANFVKPAELGSSWYIRGDVGINFNGQHSVNSYGSAAETTFFDNNITDKLTYSVGLGKRLNNYLRVEANLGRLAGADYSSSQLMTQSATDTDPGNLLVGPTEPIACNGRGEYIDLATGEIYLDDYFIQNCVSTDSVEYDTTFGMINAYVDLPKVAGFQPFIGGGIGVGRVSWRQELNAIDCTPVNEDLHLEGCSAYGTPDQPAPNEPYSQPGVVDSGVGYRIGYQLAGGLAYDFGNNITMDTSYRYTRYGDGNFKGTSGATLAADGFSVHQVNVGLRYSFF